MRYFNNYVTDEGHSYSCDMIRLKFEYNYEKSNYDIMHQINVISSTYNLILDEYQSFKLSGFRMLYKIASCKRGEVFDENVDLSYCFSIGLRHNMDIDKSAMTGFIEFNPNKCDLDVVSAFMGMLKKHVNYLGNGLYFSLIRFDMAIDIKKPRYALKLIKEGKRRYTYIQDKSLTEYLGIRHTNGFVKLYDKRVEADLDYDMTRLEITATDIDKIALPRVLYADGQFELACNLSDTDFVLVTLIRQQEEQQQQYYLSKLGRKKRNKLRPYIVGGSQVLQYDRKAILHVQEVVANAMRIDF